MFLTSNYRFPSELKHIFRNFEISKLQTSVSINSLVLTLFGLVSSILFPSSLDTLD